MSANIPTMATCSTIGSFPPEVLAIITDYLEAREVSCFLVACDKALRYRCIVVGGVESLRLWVHKTINKRPNGSAVWDPTRTSYRAPPSVYELQKLKLLQLGYSNDGMSNSGTHVIMEAEQLRKFPKTLTTLRLSSQSCMRVFLKASVWAQLVKLRKSSTLESADHYGTEKAVDLPFMLQLDRWREQEVKRTLQVPLQQPQDDQDHQMESLSSEVLEKHPTPDPWIDINDILPTLTHLGLDHSHILHYYAQYPPPRFIVDYLSMFLDHLPRSLASLDNKAFDTRHPALVPHLPPELISWTCHYTHSSYFNWVSDSSDVMESIQVLHMPTTLQRLVLQSGVSVQALMHFPQLTYLSCTNLTSETTSSSIELLPRSLRYLYVSEEWNVSEDQAKKLPPLLTLRLPRNVDGLTVEWLGNAPATLTKLDCQLLNRWRITVPQMEAFSAFKLIELRLFCQELPLAAIPLLPATLTSLILNVSTWSDSRVYGVDAKDLHPHAPPALATLPLAHLRCLPHVTRLSCSEGAMVLTQEFFDCLPNIRDLSILQGVMSDQQLLHLPPALNLLRLDCICHYGHLLKLFPSVVPTDGTVLRSTLEAAFAAWHGSVDLIVSTSSHRYEQVEVVPEGTKRLKNLTWVRSEVSELPQSLQALSAGFRLRYKDIPRLPQAITSAIGAQLLLEADDCEALMSAIPRDARNLSLPATLLQTARSQYTFLSTKQPSLDPLCINITSSAFLQVPPALSSLEISEDFALDEKCLEALPRCLMKLVIHGPILSVLFFSVVSELPCLRELSLVPDAPTINENLLHLPPNLVTLRLFDRDTNDGQLHISLAAIKALPPLTSLFIMASNDLQEACIEYLPRTLTTLNMKSPRIREPAWHAFPPNLTSVALGPDFKIGALVNFLKRRRSTSSPTD